MIPETMQMDWFKKWKEYSPSRVALHDGDSGRKLTYKECYERICQITHFLKEEYHFSVGDRVAVIAQNELDYILLFFALQRLRLVLVPINFRLKAKEWDYILEDCQPKLLLYQEDMLSEVEKLSSPSTPRVMSPFKDFFNKAKNWPSQPQPYRACPEDLAMVLYTSGTTGFPKGAMITHQMIFWNSLNTTIRLNITEEDHTVTFLPFFHTGGWNVLTTPFLHRGASLTILKKFEPAQVMDLCEQESSTILFGVPTTMDMMARTDSFRKHSLKNIRYAVVGGEPLPLEQIKIWGEKGVPVRQGYGLTEFGPNVFSLNQEDALRKMGSIGFPNFYVEAKILDNDDKELGVDEIGELVLKGPMCMKGYWRNEEATAQAIKEGWLYTGDLVKRDAEGYYYVVGRKKEMYISGGENVYPAEVERVLYSIEGVLEAAVIGVPDEKWGEVGKAFIASEKSLTEKEIIDHCQSCLAKFKVPKHIEFLSELPKGDSGKILKRELN